MYVTRAIESVLSPSHRPVLVLEGPRTSGKTAVARYLVETGVWDRLESLARPSTLQLARQDPVGWLESMPDHVIIDEAQLLPDLSLLVKELVDRQTNRRLLLTGSAHLARTGLGGTDPLAGRVRRWRLSPMTGAELSGRALSMTTLVERLLNGAVLEGGLASGDGPGVLGCKQPGLGGGVAWRAMVARGGFPLLALGVVPPGESDQWARDTVISL
ncbi:MAG: AAA family ATPase, partial [Propionibacteriaceae bacterium]|nr:AAA family ATPase [Propionibacteriaceae bacterium]